MTYIQGNAKDYHCRGPQYDLILCFGVVCYLSNQEILQMLRYCMGMLLPNGTILLKGQGGLNHRKLIHKYSEELGAMYFADYQQTDETRLLCKELGLSVEVIDLYPPDLNCWPDTHDYAFALTMAELP